MIINIFGSDTYRSRQYLNKNITRFKEKRDPQGYNVAILDYLDKNIISTIKSSPFLAEKRLIVINNILSSKDKRLILDIIDIIKNDQMLDGNIIIFYQDTVQSKIKEVKDLEKILKQQEYSEEFEILKGAKMLVWIKKEVKDRGGSIDESAASYLSQNCGGDMWFLVSVLGQLIAYVDGRNMTAEDMQLFLEEKIDDNIFNMVDAIISGNKKSALKLLNEQRRLGEDETKIFGLIIWQFKILLEMRSLFEITDNVSSDYLAKSLNIHPFVAKKNFYLVKRHSLNQLKIVHKKLLDIDLKIKTGHAGQSLLIDLFVLST